MTKSMSDQSLLAAILSRGGVNWQRTEPETGGHQLVVVAEGQAPVAFLFDASGKFKGLQVGSPGY